MCIHYGLASMYHIRLVITEFYDMLMLQNAQMHQLFMQQMLTQGLQTPKHEPQTLVIEQASQPQPFIPPQPQYITVGLQNSV